jgi:hypothetical protein
MKNIINSVSNTLMVMMSTIEEYFPATFITTQIIGEARATLKVPPAIYVRLVWRQRYTGVFFDTNNIIHRLQIKGIYMEYSMDYCPDPLFKDALGLTLVD